MKNQYMSNTATGHVNLCSSGNFHLSIIGN